VTTAIAASFLSYASILTDVLSCRTSCGNLVCDVPAVGPRQFLPHVQKVVPSVELDDIEHATGYGGVRPQIVGDDVIFNITPSPGASTCLKNAMRDTRTLTEFLDCEFDEAAFREDTIEQLPRDG